MEIFLFLCSFVIFFEQRNNFHKCDFVFINKPKDLFNLWHLKIEIFSPQKYGSHMHLEKQ